jgi:hypothetical protein
MQVLEVSGYENMLYRFVARPEEFTYQPEQARENKKN